VKQNYEIVILLIHFLRQIFYRSLAKFIVAICTIIKSKSWNRQQGTLIKCSRLSHASQTMWRLVLGPMTTSRSAATRSHANCEATEGAFSLPLPIHFSAERNRQCCEINRRDSNIDLGFCWPALLSLSLVFYSEIVLRQYTNSQIVQVLKWKTQICLFCQMIKIILFNNRIKIEIKRAHAKFVIHYQFFPNLIHIYCSCNKSN